MRTYAILCAILAAGGFCRSTIAEDIDAALPMASVEPPVTAPLQSRQLENSKEGRAASPAALSPFTSWGVTWSGYQGRLIESRSGAAIETPGEVNLTVELPRYLEHSSAPLVYPDGESDVRELNVVLKAQGRDDKLTLRGNSTNVVLGAVLTQRDPKRIKKLFTDGSLVGGAVLMPASMRPQRVHMITRIEQILDERRGGSPASRPAIQGSR